MLETVERIHVALGTYSSGSREVVSFVEDREKAVKSIKVEVIPMPRFDQLEICTDAHTQTHRSDRIRSEMKLIGDNPAKGRVIVEPGCEKTMSTPKPFVELLLEPSISMPS